MKIKVTTNGNASLPNNQEILTGGGESSNISNSSQEISKNHDIDKKNRKIVPIVLCPDNNYAKYASVTIQSIIENSSKNDDVLYEIYILVDDDFNPINKTFLEKMADKNVSISTINIPNIENKNKLYSKAHFTRQMYYRFFIPELFSQYDKVIYIDCDTVVLSDIQELYDIDLNNKLIGAVLNPIKKLKDYVEKTLKTNPEEYINSGVLILNTNECLNFHLKEKSLNLIYKNKNYKYPDQDVLNIVAKDNIEFLPSYWNFQWNNQIMLSLKYNKQKLIHYTTK